MADRWLVALAASAALGALRPSPTPLLVGATLVVAALAARRPAVLCLAVALCTSSLAQRALDGLDGIQTGTVRAEVVLLTDPEPSFDGLRAEARLRGRHVELRATGATAESIRDRLAGEHLVVRGAVRPLVTRTGWAAVRHLAGTLQVHRVEGVGPPALPWRLANGVRRTIAGGAAPLPEAQRGLFAGLVLGDDRDQPVGLADDFRGAGLTHLLAVSGQNVAFVLALVAPLGRRLHLAPRLVLTLAAIGLFAVMTRFEPSVVRASAMAGVAAAAGTAGLPAQRLRVLAVALTGLLLLDPLLVRSIGFQLSVGATIAIAAVSRPIATSLPGPMWLREPVAVTIAAQLGVAPILLGHFGPIPLASLPANVLAVPAAGLVMGWGLTAGVVAGLLAGPGATVLHLPTRLLLGWIEQVAARSARLPAGELGSLAVVLVAVALAAWVAGNRTARLPLRAGGRWLAVVTLVGVVLAHRAPAPLRSELAPGLVRWHAGSTDVVVVRPVGWRSAPRPDDVLAALRRARVGGIDLLVAEGADAALLEAVVARHPTGAVVTSTPLPDRSIAVIRPPSGTTTTRVGGLIVTLAPGERGVVVDARPASVDAHQGMAPTGRASQRPGGRERLSIVRRTPSRALEAL